MEVIHSLDSPTPGKLLDAAAGNGRFRDYLESQGSRLNWIGIDFSLPLLDRARGNQPSARICADLSEDPGLPLRPGMFVAVVAFGLFHHIASFEARRLLLARLAEQLVPDGRLILTHWQFTEVATIVDRILPWREATAQGLSIDLEDLEDDDHLLGWGEAPSLERSRYCHHVVPDEATRLATSASLEIEDQFFSDGRTGTLNLYQILKRPASRTSGTSAQ